MGDPATPSLQADKAAQDKTAMILGISYPVTVLASLFVTGRLFSRRRQLGRWAADDYIVLLCMVSIPRTFLVYLVASIADHIASNRDWSMSQSRS